MQLTLTLLNGETIKYNVEENTVTLGRSSKCTIHIPHEGMSRKHCQIEVVKGEIYITDLDSTNGVFIDNVRIPSSQRVPYSTFLPLSFGAVTSLQIELETGFHRRPEVQVRSTEDKKEPKELPSKNKPHQAPKRKDKVSTRFWAFNLVILGFVLFLAHWWYTDENVKMPENYYESADEIPTTYLNQ